MILIYPLIINTIINKLSGTVILVTDFTHHISRKLTMDMAAISHQEGSKGWMSQFKRNKKISSNTVSGFRNHLRQAWVLWTRTRRQFVSFVYLCRGLGIDLTGFGIGWPFCYWSTLPARPRSGHSGPYAAFTVSSFFREITGGTISLTANSIRRGIRAIYYLSFLKLQNICLQFTIYHTFYS